MLGFRSRFKKYLSVGQLYSIAQHYDRWYGENYEGASINGLGSGLRAAGYIDSYRWCEDIEQVVHYLRYHGSLAFSCPWFEGMQYVEPDGILRTTGLEGGLHVTVLFGVNKAGDEFLDRNSYGPEWANSGNGIILRSTLEKLWEMPHTSACAFVLAS